MSKGQKESHAKTEYETNPERIYIARGGFRDSMPEGTSPACLDMDTEEFFPDGIKNAERPQVCIDCTITTYCLSQSIKMGELEYGIWGAAVPHERKMLAKMPEPKRSAAIRSFISVVKTIKPPAQIGYLPGTSVEPTQREECGIELTKDTIGQVVIAAAVEKPKDVELDDHHDVSFIEYAGQELGLNDMSKIISMNTLDWIDALRAVEVHGEAIELVAERYELSPGTLKNRIKRMQLNLKTFPTDLRNVVLGITAA